MIFKLDPELRQYATDAQWQKLEALATYGSERAAAETLKIHRSNLHAAKKAVLAKAAQHGYSPDHDMVHQLPDGYQLRGTSTLYDSKTGEPKIQWVKSEIDKERQHEIFMEVIEGLTSGLPKADLTVAPTHPLSADLMACYPIGDLHLGMLSWKEETGANYDLKIGERLLFKAVDYLTQATPACERALVVALGDFFHYDSMVAITPTGKNQLDSDSRPAKMIRVGTRCLRYQIETAAARHGYVHVIVGAGNHDPFSTLFLIECLRNIYENDPRITIETSPSHYQYYRFGQNLIGVNHGHDTKMQNLPLIMAADRPGDWGVTKHRMWWTGHIHHSKTQAAVSSQDYTGCTVESFQVLGPEDAWAHQKGYRAKRSQKAIVLHCEYGEFSRHTVNPEMF